MATDTVRDALNRLRDWGDTIRHYNTRTVVGGGGDTRAQWVGHEEFFADLAILTQRLAEMEAAAREVWASVPATCDGPDTIRHARALNDLGALLHRDTTEAK